MSIAFKIYIHFIRNTLIKSIVYPRCSNAESTKKEREREKVTLLKLLSYTIKFLHL